jgi:hypothetical protein
MQPSAKITPNFADQVKSGLGSVPFPVVPMVQIQPPPQPAPAPEPPLKVALIGTAPSSRMLAPFGDPSWKIWACSPGNMNVLPRIDIWFELHGNMHWPECAAYGPQYVEWLKKQKFPIYMQNQQFVENALTFPMIKLVREYGQYFFTSSFAWMIAFAMSSGAKEIGLYGIDMASRNEYILQRQGFYYFLDIAAKRGITVTAPLESDIMQPPGLYGYSEVTNYGRKAHARQHELQTRIAQMTPERDGHTRNITYLEGALEDIDYFVSIQIGVTNEIVLQAAEISDLKQQIVELQNKLAGCEKKE